MELLESNIYILTELIQQYFYTYLYHEAGYLDSLQAALTARLWLELGLVAAGALVLVGVLMRRSAAISRSITQPIYALRERAQSIGRGDLAAREPVVAEDETLQALSSSIEPDGAAFAAADGAQPAGAGQAPRDGAGAAAKPDQPAFSL